tara:strand:+ start:12407 stop:13162 length:756 start_codon:yes stop_codon:yes gene_type:complete
MSKIKIKMAYSIEEYKKRFANHIEEAGSKSDAEIAKTIGRALYLSRVATRKDFADFKETFKDYDHGLGGWKKWGGGNKRASGTSATRKAKIAAISKAVGDNASTVNTTLSPDAKVNKYQQRSYDDGLGFKINQALARVNARFNDTQGKNMPSNPSFGYSNHSRTNSYNTHGVGTRGDGSSSTYGGTNMGSFSNKSADHGGAKFSGLIAGDPNRGLNRGKTYGKDGDIKSITTDSDFGIRMRKAMEGWTPTA